MSWFDDQLKQRRQADTENFEDAISGIAGAVMGKRLAEALDNKEIAQSAIEEILRYYHRKPKNDELPATVKNIEDQIEYRMRPFGIMHRGVELDKGWYKYAFGAMLGTMKESGNAVALIPGKFAGYYYLDLTTGEKVKLNRRNEGLIDNLAVCFYEPLPLKPLGIPDLIKFMIEQLTLSDKIMFVGLMGVSTLLGMLTPVFTKWLFGSVLQSGSTSVLLAIAAFMISFSVCQLLFGAYKTLINAKITMKQNIAVQAAVMSRLMSLPTGFFKKYSSGELTQRAMYVQSLCSTLMNTIGTVGISSLFSLVYIGQIFSFAPAIVVPSLLVTLATVVVTFITTVTQTKVSKELMQTTAKTSGMTYSMLTGIQKIKLSGAEKRMFSRWARAYSKEARLKYNPPMFLRVSNVITLAVSLGGSLLISWLAYKSGVSVSNYYAFNSAYGMVSSAFMALAGIAVTIASIAPTLEMAKPIMEAEPELADGKETITQLTGSIELSHVSFKYEEGMPNVIDDLSLNIRKGEYVAVVGSTGCGKSTLVRLLLGFEKPQKGAIYYDRKDISRIDLKSLRRKIGTVMQDGKLFLGDIYSNIVISAPELTLDDAWKAAEIASVADDIKEMPMGMNTIISEGQGGISGGQKQRLMIARAVAPRPKILIFDEATSALDNVTQKKVSEAIDSLDCTRIVIAHRLSTIRHCDRIIVLDKGKIVEDGKYEKLIEDKGFFAELVARQRLDYEE